MKASEMGKVPVSALSKVLLHWLARRQILLSEHFDDCSVFRISIPFFMNLTLFKNHGS